MPCVYVRTYVQHVYIHTYVLMCTALLSNLLHSIPLLHSGYVSAFDIAEYCTKGHASSTSPTGTCTTLNNAFHCPNDCIMKLHMYSADNVGCYIRTLTFCEVTWCGVY